MALGVAKPLHSGTKGYAVKEALEYLKVRCFARVRTENRGEDTEREEKKTESSFNYSVSHDRQG